MLIPFQNQVSCIYIPVRRLQEHNLGTLVSVFKNMFVTEPL